MYRVLIVLLMAAASVSAQVTPSRYAILIGISRYQAGEGKFDLEGPRYDVASLRDVLVQRHGYIPSNILELTDEKATKQAILAALSARVRAMKPADHLLFYFSGHGTSAFDRNMVLLAPSIGPDSGALAPYDLRLDTLESAADSLIIGRRDIRPILERLHQEARALVVIDACYSENSVKSLGRALEGDARAINLVTVIQQSSRSSPATSTTAQVSAAKAVEQPADLRYPYANVVAISAASKDETAKDINTDLIRARRFETLDQKPHGAFSNSFLIALAGAGDTNGDGTLSYDELYRFTRQSVQSQHPQTPQILSPTQQLLASPALGSNARGLRQNQPAAGTNTESSVTRIRLEGVSSELQSRIQTLKSVAIASDNFDLLVRQQNDTIALYHRSTSLIRRYSLAESELLLRRIAAQTQVDQLIRYGFRGQDFNLSLDVDLASPAGNPAEAHRGEFILDETIIIKAGSEQPAFLLILSVDSTGVINVLFPGPADRQPVANTAQVEVVRGQVHAPTGTEFLKAFGFREKPAGFDDFACRAAERGLVCPSIEPGDQRHKLLLAMLASGDRGRSETMLKLVTTDR